MDDRRLADARLDLLRQLVEGLRCVTPDRYQRDCGKCYICRCRYRTGALEGYNPGSYEPGIPGTREIKAASREFHAQLDLARARQKEKRR